MFEARHDSRVYSFIYVIAPLGATLGDLAGRLQSSYWVVRGGISFFLLTVLHV
jgi:hypothetical protein